MQLQLSYTRMHACTGSFYSKKRLSKANALPLLLTKLQKTMFERRSLIKTNI